MIITTPPCSPSWTSGTSRSCPLRWEPPASARTCTQSGWSQASPGFEFVICWTFWFVLICWRWVQVFCRQCWWLRVAICQVSMSGRRWHDMCLTGGRDILPLLLLHLCQSPSSQPTILICHVQSLSKCCSFFNLSSANRSLTHFFAHISTLRTSHYI